MHYRPSLNEIISRLQSSDSEELGIIVILCLMRLRTREFKREDYSLWMDEIRFVMEELPIMRYVP